MGKSKVIKVGDREVICRELTVSAVRQLLSAQSSGDAVTEALFPDVRLDDFKLMSSLSAEDIESMFPSDLAKVLEGCREVNRDFFGLLGRLSKPVSQA